jgi:urease accessory protein
LHPAQLLRLLQLTSPSFPTGAFAYSQGLEAGVEAGWLHSEAATYDWIAGQLGIGMTHLEVPLFRRLYHAWQTNDAPTVARWVSAQLAYRESRELREEDLKVGRALLAALVSLDVTPALAWSGPMTWLGAYALGAAHWRIPLRAAAQAFLFAWCENQAMAASRLIPLGQKATQRVLTACLGEVPAAVLQGLALDDESIGRSAPGHSLACIAHETQYSRLFLS